MQVSIRRWRMEDAADIAAAINNKKVQDNLRDGIPYPYTQKDAEEYIWKAITADKDAEYAFAILCDTLVVGSIAVSRLDNVHRLTAEMGYYIAEPFWGQGITTEAVRLVCAYIFFQTDIVRIFAEPYAYNTASCRVLEKAGFQLEGILRHNALKNGRTLDMKMYSLLRAYPVRPLSGTEIETAMALVRRVFDAFEAPEYSEEGIASFYSFIETQTMRRNWESGNLRLWGAFDNAILAGVAAFRPPYHISLLFVDSQYHGRGIARSLLQEGFRDLQATFGTGTVTVNSSPYAVEIYRHMGFEAADTEQSVNGLRFTPMKRALSPDCSFGSSS